MNKLGAHIQRLTNEILDWIDLAKPTVVVWVDPNQDGVDAIKQRSPNTFVVGRKFEDGRDWRATPPIEWAYQCAKMARCDAYICWNEPLSHDDLDSFAAFDEWQANFRQAILAHGMEAIAFNFATGNFTAAPDRRKVNEHFPLSCEAFRFFGGHEYYWPTMSGGVIWYVLRFPTWHDDIGRDDVEFIITECGMTQAVHYGKPDVGWRTYEDGVTDASYLAELDWYNRELCKLPYVRGAAVYNWGGYGWETFEHSDHQIRFQIAGLDAPGPEPPPTEPPEEPVNDKIRVVDMEYNERDFDYAKAKYGVAYRRAQVPQGQKVYRLVELWEKTGDHSLITKVLDENGDPIQNMGVAFYWVDAPSPPDPPTEVLSHDWHSNFKHGLTNENGEVGPGMGRGAYHDPGAGGPHAVWIRDPNVPSDICEKLGMLGGTNHDHLNQVFQLTTEGEKPQPPPTNGGKGMFVIVDRDDVPTGINAVEIEVAEGSKKDFYDTRFLMQIVGPDGEVWMDEDEFGVMHPEIRRFYKELPYVPTPGETTRVYQFKIVKADDLAVALSDWLSFAFNRDEVKRTNTKAEWQAETEPPPTPPPTPPPSTDIPTRLRQIADELKSLADQWTGQVSASEVRLIFPGGRQEVYKPSLTSAVARLMRRLRR